MLEKIELEKLRGRGREAERGNRLGGDIECEIDHLLYSSGSKDL